MTMLKCLWIAAPCFLFLWTPARQSSHQDYHGPGTIKCFFSDHHERLIHLPYTWKDTCKWGEVWWTGCWSFDPNHLWAVKHLLRMCTSCWLLLSTCSCHVSLGQHQSQPCWQFLRVIWKETVTPACFDCVFVSNWQCTFHCIWQFQFNSFETVLEMFNAVKKQMGHWHIFLSQRTTCRQCSEGHRSPPLPDHGMEALIRTRRIRYSSIYVPQQSQESWQGAAWKSHLLSSPQEHPVTFFPKKHTRLRPRKICVCSCKIKKIWAKWQNMRK